jgi:hypothetical protein
MVRPDWRRATLAHGIVDGADRGAPTRARHWLPDGPSWAVRGSGGMLSTVGDLARWTRALAAGTVLSASAVRAATTAHAPLPPNPLGITGMGYGWLLGADAHGPVRLIEGADRIFFSELRWYPGRDVVVAFATNTPATGSWRGEESCGSWRAPSPTWRWRVRRAPTGGHRHARSRDARPARGALPTRRRERAAADP